jgi:hypothetical protein
MIGEAHEHVWILKSHYEHDGSITYINLCQVCGINQGSGHSFSYPKVITDEGSKTTVHQCPVCYGRGQVAGGFYLGNGPVSTSANLMDKCRSCDGKGYLVL